MARHARLRLPGFPFHVVHRGVDRNVCFRSPEDFRLYVALLQEFAPQLACALHAYVLMPNHIHLLITPATADGLSQCMKDVAQRYSQYVNRHWRRTGPLWEGRFKSCLVDSGRYALNCYRYIERNPVRAGMVRHPAEYPWSSFRANAYGLPSPVIAEHEAYRSLGDDESSRRLAYRELFDLDECVEEVEEIRAALRSGSAYGSDAFIAKLGPAALRKALRARQRRHRMAPQPGAVWGLSPV